MPYDRSIIPVLEAAIDRNPFCTACGARNRVRADGDAIFLECASWDAPRGILARMMFVLVPHERIRVLP